MRIYREMQEEQEVKLVDEDAEDDKDFYGFKATFGVYRELQVD